MKWRLLLIVLLCPAFGFAAPLKVYQCPSLQDARDCTGACKLMPGGPWLKQLRIVTERNEVVVITRRDGKVDGITGLQNCSIYDRENWICPPVSSGGGNKIMLGYQMRNKRLFQYSSFNDQIVNVSCAKN